MKGGPVKRLFPLLLIAPLLTLPLTAGAQTTSGTIPTYSSTCTGGSTTTLIDTATDFTYERVGRGAIVRNIDDDSEGIVTSVTTTTNPNDTLQIAAAMSGGASNAAGEEYAIVGEEWDATMNPIIVTGDITVPGHARGICDAASDGNKIVDLTKNFVTDGVTVGMPVVNETKGATGIVTGFANDTYPNDTLVIVGGMSGGALNGAGDSYFVGGYLRIGHACDIRFLPGDDTHWGWDILRSEIILYGGIEASGTFPESWLPANTCTQDGGSTTLLDDTVDFASELVGPGAIVLNETDGTEGIVSSVGLSGTCDQNGGTTTLIDTTKDFIDREVVNGMPVDNDTDGSTGTVTVVGLSGACTSGSATTLVDTTRNFTNEGIVANMRINNSTDGSTGIVTSITTTTNPNDTLQISGGMNGGATNDPGDAYNLPSILYIGGGMSGGATNDPGDAYSLDNILYIENGMTGGGTNDNGDDYRVIVPAILTSTGTATQGWFGIVFSDYTATGRMSYCNIDHSVYGVNFTACAQPPYEPIIADCTINDVSVGIYFDNESSPEVTGTTVIQAATAFDCWAFSRPTITYCNAAKLLGDAPRAVYSTEIARPHLIGCAFATGMIELDMAGDVLAQDTTISDAENAVIGQEYKEVGAGKIISSCSAQFDNCNIIGVGDAGNGIEWDDQLDVCKVQYSRIGGFSSNAFLRWGSIDILVGLYHKIGLRFFGNPVAGYCDEYGGNTLLIDTTTNFSDAGAEVGTSVRNLSKNSIGIVTAISTTTNPNDTLEIDRGMTGGTANDVLDVYYFTASGLDIQWLSGTADFGGSNYIGEWLTDYTDWGVPIGGRVVNIGNGLTGSCTNNGGNTTLIDTTANFVTSGVQVGWDTHNSTDGSFGTVTGITTTTNPNDTLQIADGMSGAYTNDFGDSYEVGPAGIVIGFRTTTRVGAYSENNTLETSTMSPPNAFGDYYHVWWSSDFVDDNNADFGDLDNPNPFRNWPLWYYDPVRNPTVTNPIAAGTYAFSEGENEFYGIQNPENVFNIECEQNANLPPRLYQLDAWAENNWWVTTNDTIVDRYVWDHMDHYLLGLVSVLPHRSPDEKRTYSVSGTILDNINDPVEGVRVSALEQWHTGSCTSGTPSTYILRDDTTNFAVAGAYEGAILRNTTDTSEGIVTQVGHRGTATSGSNTILIDVSVDFTALGIEPGMTVINETAGSYGVISSLTGTTQLNIVNPPGMVGGVRQTNQPGDTYFIPNVLYLSGGMSGGATNEVHDNYILFRELADITGTNGVYTIYGLLPGKGYGAGDDYIVTPQKLFYAFTPLTNTITIDDSDITDEDFDAKLPPPRIIGAGRDTAIYADTDPAKPLHGVEDFWLEDRTNWGKDDESTDIVITGLNFRETPSVFLRGPLPADTDTPLGNVTWVTSTKLTATVPSGMALGNYVLRVVNPDGQSVMWGDGTLSGTCTADGGNTTLVDSGTNFFDAQVSWYAYLTNNASVPNQTGRVTRILDGSPDTLRIDGGMSQGETNDTGDSYTVNIAPAFTIVPDPPPHVFSIAADKEPPVDVIDWDFDGGITVSGSNFQDGCNLTIDGQTWSSLTPEGGGSLTVDYDPRMISIGTWQVIVTNPDGQASVEDVTLEVTGDETPPDIISITPNHGPKNKEVFPVVIAGTDFVDTPTVLIGNLVCSVTFDSAAQLTIRVPVNDLEPGAYDVTVINPDSLMDVLPNGYTVDPPTLDVIGISPPMGLTSAETDIIIAGQYFTAADPFAIPPTSDPTVTIGATACTNVRYISSTCLLATVPSSIAAGLYDVTVQNDDGNPVETLTDGYTVVTVPTISSPIVPDNGNANDTTAITINGSDFAYLPRVEIGTTPPVACTEVDFDSSAQLTAKVPSGLNAGTYDVTVINPLDQSAALAGSYTVNAPPAGEPVIQAIPPSDDAVFPSTGTNDADTDITITGVNFTGVTGVTVGGTACVFTEIDDTQIDATVPAGIRPGSYDLTVTVPAGTGTKTHGFVVGGSGTLVADTTLSGNVNITGDIVVPEGVTLTLDPSSMLIFAALSDDTSGGWDGERGEIRVYGRINILGGEEAERVALTSDGAKASDWLGIVLSDESASAWIEHVDITNAVYGLSFESSLRSPSADDPRPWVQYIQIANCATGVALNSSAGFTCPAIDQCSIDTTETGISARGIASPIFTTTLLRNISSVGLEALANSIVTLENSSILDAPSVVSCPAAAGPEPLNEAAVNVIFSLLGNGAVGLSDSSTMTARMVTHLLFPDVEASRGVSADASASLTWEYSNLVQGYSSGTGIDWSGEGALSMSASVVEGWGIGIRRRGDCGEVNLGDGNNNPGLNEFLGIMNPEATYNVANGDPSSSSDYCSSDISAQYNWWLTDDYSVIENYLYDENDLPALGDIDYSGYLGGPRTYSVSGRILDGGGLPVERAQVVAYYSTTHTDNDRIGMTDEDGYYKIYGLVPGDYDIIPQKQYHTFNPTDISVTITDTDINGQDFVGSPPDPAIYGITPNWGYNNMNTDVIISGIFLRNPPLVYLRGPLPGSSTETPLTNVQWLSSTTITATVQGGFCAGGYAVRVVNPDGGEDYWIDIDTPGFTVYNPPAPVLYSIDPVSVWQDTENIFLIQGEYFYGPPTVCFGTVCAGYTYEEWGSTYMIVRVPAYALNCGTGPQDVIAINPAPPCETEGVPSNAVQITVQCPIPTPTPQPPHTPTPSPTIPIRAFNLAPPLGLATPVPTPAVTPGTDIVVVGEGIKDTPGPSVSVGAAACTNVRFVSATSLLATVPDGIAPGTYDVQIDNNDGQAVQTLPNAYSVVAPPSVTGVTINSGSGYNNGTTNITVTGADFSYMPKVEVGTARCVDVEFVSTSELTANVPSGLDAGTYDVTVVNPLNQTGTLAGAYTVLNPPGGQPVILSVSPPTGANSTTTEITILGTDFPASPTVRVGSTTCTDVVRVDATQITATVPASVIGMLPGDYGVTVTDLGANSATMTKGFTLGGSGTLNAGNWTISRSVSMSGDLVIPDDATLTVYPGVTLTFAANADDSSGGWDNERGEIRVYGRLNILGEVDNRVTVTSDGSASGDWFGIDFSDLTATGLIEYADISNAGWGINFRSAMSIPTAENPKPRVSNVSISNCGGAFSAGSLIGPVSPVIDRCVVENVAIGVETVGNPVPIVTSTEFHDITTMAVYMRDTSIVTIWNSALLGAPTAVSCEYLSAINLIFSATRDGVIDMSESSSLTGRMATLSQSENGISGNGYALCDWTYSNIVQGPSTTGSVGMDWESGDTCNISYSVLESWGTAARGYGGVLNLGDGVDNDGMNDFIGHGIGAGYLSVQKTGGDILWALNNWWLTTDPSEILHAHDPLDGTIYYIPYLTDPRTYSVEGNVVNSSDQAVDGARVVAYYLPREPFTNRDNDRMALADENGDYKLFGLIPGDYDITLLLNSGMSTTEYVKIGSSDVTGVDLVKGIPMVTSISPDTAANTAAVTATIRGNFFESNSIVKLMKDGQDFIRGTGYTVAGATEITGCQFDILGAPPERWDVVVTNSDNTTGRLTAGFLITGPQPTVTGVNPASIPYLDDVGETETVSVYGTNFYSTSRVTIGNQELSDVVLVSPIELRGTVTVGIAPGWHDVTVTNGDEKASTLASSFYVVPPPGGTIIIDYLDPNGGSAGDFINIYGSGFAGIPEVIFNPGTHHATNEVLVSPTQVLAIVPSGLTEGTWYDVTVNNLDLGSGAVMATGSLAHAFRYGNPEATVTSITPDYGVNTETTDVAIGGDDFKDGLTASIGTTACTDVSVESVIRITANVPAGINPGYHDVVVENTGALAGRLRYGFRVDADTDGDLMGDWWEYLYWGDLDEQGAGDWDGDGFSNLEEYRNDTNPLINSDIDGDGMPDYWEDLHGLDKYDPSDASEDSDGDGFTNLEEFLANHRGGTNPADDTSTPDAGADWDEDGIENTYELKFGLNPKVDDGGDGADGDPDGDGITNRDEFAAGSNPMNANSTPDNPNVLAGTLAVLREEGGVDQNIYFYNTVRPGDTVYWDSYSRNPSALARDFWVLPRGNEVRSIAAIDIGQDDVSELAVLRLDEGVDPNLYIYSAPGYGERSYADADARNAAPLARDFWIMPAGDVVAMASIDADGDGTEEAAVLKRAGSDINLYLYSWPVPGDFTYWDVDARNPSPLARDFWCLPAGNNVEAMAPLDGDGDGVDELAVVRRENGNDYNLYLYHCPVPGDWTYWDSYARNPSALARDFWIIPSGNDVSRICGLDADLDDRDELIVLKSTGDGDHNLYVYDAPALGDWGYHDASSRNPAPLARDLWIIPGANDVEAITSVR